MPVTLRFIQRVRPSDMPAYLAVEARFVDWEKRQGSVTGRRLRVVAGPHPVDTFVWEGDFSTREGAMTALRAMENDTEHTDLWDEQVRYVTERFVEILEHVDF